MTSRNLLTPVAGLIADEFGAEARQLAVANEAETVVCLELLRLRLGQLGDVLGLMEAGQ
ncbi:hypothetical protein [Streptomyces xylophagus]|uniref:hypothetical protein n=1 Tax=Streptomyces xylophagus TaxID=285514 RepID=UPI000B1A6360|nr:hypothetical protein [Streptomyces xylophagus]